MLSISNITASTANDIRSDVQIIRGLNTMELSTENEILSSKRFVPAPEHRALSKCELELTTWRPSSSGDLANQSSTALVVARDKSTFRQDPEQPSTCQAESVKNTAKATYRFQEHTGRGEQLNGPEVNEAPRKSLLEITENLVYHGNIKRESKEERNKDGEPASVNERNRKRESGNSQLNGPKFANGTTAQPYAGVWENNIMEANGKQVNGSTIGKEKDSSPFHPF